MKPFVGTRAIRTARREAVLITLRKHRDRPVTATQLAGVCQIIGVPDGYKRRIRELIRELRRDGHEICADSSAKAGYWLARSRKEWAAYKEARRTGARFEFGAVARMATAASEQRTGQGRLFEDATWKDEG